MLLQGNSTNELLHRAALLAFTACKLNLNVQCWCIFWYTLSLECVWHERLVMRAECQSSRNEYWICSRNTVRAPQYVSPANPAEFKNSCTTALRPETIRNNPSPWEVIMYLLSWHGNSGVSSGCAFPWMKDVFVYIWAQAQWVIIQRGNPPLDRKSVV